MSNPREDRPLSGGCPLAGRRVVYRYSLTSCLLLVAFDYYFLLRATATATGTTTMSYRVPGYDKTLVRAPKRCRKLQIEQCKWCVLRAPVDGCPTFWRASTGTSTWMHPATSDRLLCVTCTMQYRVPTTPTGRSRRNEEDLTAILR